MEWERVRRQNHWLDALYNACAARHGCGVRLVREHGVEPEPRGRDDGTPRIDPQEWLNRRPRW